MDALLFSKILFGFGFFYLIVGWISSRSVTSTDSYFLANRNLGFFALTFALIATQLGSGMLLGTAEKAYHLGWWGIVYTLGFGVGFLLLGLGFAARMRALHIDTTAQIFSEHYKSNRLRSVASLLSILSLCGLLLAQIIASKQLLLALGVYNPHLLFGFWLFVIGYTMLGGLHTVVFINALQVIFIFVVFVGLFIMTIKSMPSKYLTTTVFFKVQEHFFSKKLINPANLLPTFLMPVLFSLIEQDLAQRFFAARNKVIATLSAFAASFTMVAFACVPLFFGVLSRIQVKNIPAGANPLILLLEKNLSPMIFILALCGIIAAITSTADSLLCAISSNISQDFNHFFTKKVSLKKAQLITCIVGLSSLLLSWYISSDIISVLESSYRISVSCLFVPTVLAYFTTRLHKVSALLAIIGGALGFAIYIYLPPLAIKELLPVGLSAVGYIIGDLITRP